ncbi:hypothetical protein RJT34_17399 [Clitoria ternatea]|uniref:Ribosome-associated protein quality control protein P2 RNA-binding domain-containing protein n=1 Tax=Clitoria ternatea TaxID=43366 RepID=A0AAN9J8X6_CLITE
MGIFRVRFDNALLITGEQMMVSGRYGNETRLWAAGWGKASIILRPARRASLKREILHTDFLTPPVLKESMQVLEKLADVKAIAQGGYPQAERCRISVGHPEVLISDPDIISALSITGNFQFEPCSHGDILGSILDTGIARDKLGDIILQGEQGAQVIVVPELVDFLMSTLVKISHSSVCDCGMRLLFVIACCYRFSRQESEARLSPISKHKSRVTGEEDLSFRASASTVEQRGAFNRSVHTVSEHEHAEQ